MMGINTIFILLLATVFNLFACKKIRDAATDNQTKGVDNLIAADGAKAFGRNIPPYCGNRIDTNAPARWNAAADEWIASLGLVNSNEKQNLQKAVRESVANLPASVLELVRYMNLDVRMHDKAPDQCRTTFETLDPAKQEQLKQKFKDTKFSDENHFACFDSPGGNARPTIHIGGNPKLVDTQEKMTQQESFLRRLLVRNIGVAYARFFPAFIEERYVKNGGELIAKAREAANAKSATEKTQILNTAQMIEDSRKKLAEFKTVFSTYKASLRQTLMEKDKLGESAPIKRMQELINEKVVDPSEFDDIVFAEIFDSHFCNASTRQFFESNFAAAAKDFAYNAKVLIELVTPKIPQVAQQAPQPASLRR